MQSQEYKEAKAFKFQSDSINTLPDKSAACTQYPLNSNLILLIPPSPAVYNTSYSTLNSNLILLIRCTAGCLSVLRIHPFKFQSDSINTMSDKVSMPNSMTSFKFQSDSINTCNDFCSVHVTDCFKFQSDSINTSQWSFRLCNLFTFKFQSDSINTGQSLLPPVCETTLNSNLILLILEQVYIFLLYVNVPLNSNLILLIRRFE